MTGSFGGIEFLAYQDKHVNFPDREHHKLLYYTLLSFDYRDPKLYQNSRERRSHFNFSSENADIEFEYWESPLKKYASPPYIYININSTEPKISIASMGFTSRHITPCTQVGIKSELAGDCIKTTYDDLNSKKNGYFLWKTYETYLEEHPDLRIFHDISFVLGNSIIEEMKKQFNFNERYRKLKKSQRWKIA